MSSTEKSKMNKQISIHHLYYVILIAGLILLFVILLFPYGVSRYAFDNFSFASTITSIVLAVVSIVYSIQSGNSSSDQLNGVRDIERNISSQLDSFSDLEGKLKKTIEDVQRGVSEVKEGQANVKNSLDSLLLQAQNPIGDQKGEQGKFIEYNSLIGNVLLYILLILSTNSSGVYVCLHELRFSLLRTVESITTPCSVKAYERTVECFKLLNRSQFVTSSFISSLVS